MSDDPIVYVVDDDPAVGDAIRLLLRSVGLASEVFLSAGEFLERHDPSRVSCLVLDVRMPGMSGLDLQVRLEEMGAGIPILFVTAHGDIPMAVQAVKAGAMDFVQKPFRDQDLLDRIQAGLEWDRARRKQEAEIKAIEDRTASLTPREEEVMEMVVDGKPNKKIAHALGISQRTVEIHRSRVMAKMEVRSVSQLVQDVLRARDGS